MQTPAECLDWLERRMRRVTEAGWFLFLCRVWDRRWPRELKMSHLSYPALVLAGVHLSAGVLKARQAVRVSRVVQGFASSSFMPRINHSRAGKASEKARMPQPAGLRLPRLRMSPSETQAGGPR